MRDIISKLTTASMIAGAALLVSACGGEKATNNMSSNTMGGEYNSMDTMGNGGTDMMGGNMTDTNMSGGTMGGNITVDTTTGNVSGNVSTNMTNNM